MINNVMWSSGSLCLSLNVSCFVFMNECEIDMLDTNPMTDELLKDAGFLSDMKTAAALSFYDFFYLTSPNFAAKGGSL